MTYSESIEFLRTPQGRATLTFPDISGMQNSFWTAVRTICQHALSEDDHMNGESRLFGQLWQDISDHHWTIGETASEWLKLYARSRSLSEFVTISGLSLSTVANCLDTWTSFNGQRSAFPNLGFSHFRAALDWIDPEEGEGPGAIEILTWANQMQATVAEMRAWRRAQQGEDLSVEENER